MIPYRNQLPALMMIFLSVILFRGPASWAQSLYFPPVSGSTWDTIPPASLGWCTSYIDTLNQFLQDNDTKAFIVLKDGKIAMEHYFGTFTEDSIWYWASAGKSLTAFLAGIAQEEGLFSITDTVANILGPGWTNCSAAGEQKITIWNQLTMTSGFDDGVPDPDCTDDTCLVCIDTAGGRWAYHNAPYHLIHDVLETTSANTLNFYTYAKLAFSTGITGAWIDHVYYSTPRTAARFGLLSLARGVWNGDTVLHDTAYFNQMITGSQQLNRSYGYLWWLNGKSAFMLPQLQVVFPGPIIPDAPPDMVAALGKNDQKIYVVPSQNLVVVRMGESSGTIPILALSSFDHVLWQKLNDVFCGTLSLAEDTHTAQVRVYPNPADGKAFVESTGEIRIRSLVIYDAGGRIVKAYHHPPAMLEISGLTPGWYTLQADVYGSTVPWRNKLVVYR